jgi:hypothetical protein
VISDNGRGSERTLVHAETGAVVRTESLVKHAVRPGRLGLHNRHNRFEYTRGNDLFEQVNAYWG